ncbi:TPA: hypothetical protein TZW92_001877 [Streptococcus suis]|nr:hypothetical protein [Streptococcus suis]HEM4766909.1 hypothetical protein [Streptococcus suis]
MKLSGCSYFVTDQIKVIEMLQLNTMTIGKKVIGFKEATSFDSELCTELHDSCVQVH